MSLAILVNARDRLRAFLDEIDRTKELEFPYAHSLEALEKIQKDFSEKLYYIELLFKGIDGGSIKRHGYVSLKRIYDYLPILGLLRRSTDARNPFEVFFPLLRLASEVLEPGIPREERKTRLILSSEWRYSPFIRHNDPVLTGFVIIGIPACESANPLILPVAGHELGHSLWTKKNLKHEFIVELQKQIASVITNKKWGTYLKIFPGMKGLKKSEVLKLKAKPTWLGAYDWADKQSEESFCDFIGLKLFGYSYLKSFAYLLAPKLSGMASPRYPNIAVRVQNIVTAAKQYGVAIPDDYQAMFEPDATPQLGAADQFRMEVADEALQGLVPALIEKASESIDATSAILPRKDEAERIFKRYELGIPAVDVKCVADLLNAGWYAYESPEFWKANKQLFEKKSKNLSEIILKSFEVFEIERILESPHDAEV